MPIRQTLPACDECSEPVAESFHAILGGRIYRLCCEACRSSCCARHAQARPEVSTEAGRAPAAYRDALPRMQCGAYGDEWSDASDGL